MTPNIHLYDTGVDCPMARLFWKMPYQHFAGLVDHNPLIFQTGFSIFSFGVALLFLHSNFSVRFVWYACQNNSRPTCIWSGIYWYNRAKSFTGTINYIAYILPGFTLVGTYRPLTLIWKFRLTIRTLIFSWILISENFNA